MCYDKYKLIEADRVSIDGGHVDAYDWLKSNLLKTNVADDEGYKRKYRGFWVMRISVDSVFSQRYFEYLEKNKSNGDLTLSDAFDNLSGLTGDASERFEFSFISKLCHMIDSTSPIYDSQVRGFYGFPELDSSLSVEGKRERALEIMKDLRGKYQEILDEKLLVNSIAKFRKKFPDSQFSDQKIIDSLIWSYSD